MGRLKKGEQKKVQMTFRIEPDVAEKLKKIEKYGSKVGTFIDVGIYEYEKWLKNMKNDDMLSSIKDNVEFKGILKELKKELSLNKGILKELKKELSLNYETEKFSKFHKESYLKRCEELKIVVKILEKWDEYGEDTDDKGENKNDR